MKNGINNRYYCYSYNPQFLRNCYGLFSFSFYSLNYLLFFSRFDYWSLLKSEYIEEVDILTGYFDNEDETAGWSPTN